MNDPARPIFRSDDKTRSDGEIRADIAARLYDFADFGSSTGGSIDYCLRRFRTPRGLGLDILENEVNQIRARGFDALRADLTQFDCPPGSFRFVSMMDFLEHLPNPAVVELVLHTARQIARDFIFIRHPSFENEPFLNALGLKEYWTDWPTGHTCKLTIPELTAIFARIGFHQYALYYRNPALDSSSPAILPISAPPDQHAYDPAAHDPKPPIVFPRPLYGQIDILVALRPFHGFEWQHIIDFFD